MRVSSPSLPPCVPWVKAHLTRTFPTFQVSQREVQEHLYQRPEDLVKMQMPRSRSGPNASESWGAGLGVCIYQVHQLLVTHTPQEDSAPGI